MVLGEQRQAQLIKEAHEAKLLKRFLAEKLNGYCGISHDELKTISSMFDITKEGDSE